MGCKGRTSYLHLGYQSLSSESQQPTGDATPSVLKTWESRPLGLEEGLLEDADSSMCSQTESGSSLRWTAGNLPVKEAWKEFLCQYTDVWKPLCWEVVVIYSSMKMSLSCSPLFWFRDLGVSGEKCLGQLWQVSPEALGSQRSSRRGRRVLHGREGRESEGGEVKLT